MPLILVRDWLRRSKTPLKLWLPGVTQRAPLIVTPASKTDFRENVNILLTIVTAAITQQMQVLRFKLFRELQNCRFHLFSLHLRNVGPDTVPEFSKLLAERSRRHNCCCPC